MGKEDDTPPNMDLLIYKIGEVREDQRQFKEMLSEFLSTFNNHLREDTIVAEQLRVVIEERKSNSGLWSGLAGVGAGVGAFIYALFGNK